jgi:alpha-glucosidase
METAMTIKILCLAVLSVVLSLTATAQTKVPVAHSRDPWWKHAVIYEIYPRSFQDSDGDGIGDLNGITQRLDHLQALGVDAIWLAPIYPSPQVDFGYDISDYENIDPQYGTLADLDRLIGEAKKHNIRVLMDMVMNHTSNEHPWFIESASSRNNPRRDWYIWRDGKGPGKPPNNWLSEFGHSAWQYDANTGQWYFHRYYIQQPDLNWRNPEVQKAMFDMVRFWLDRSVAGFRLDAITNLFEDPNLRDADLITGPNGQPVINAYGDEEVKNDLYNNLPEVHDIVRRLRALVDSYPGDRVLVGETYLDDVADLDRWYGGGKHDELQLPMDIQFALTPKLDATLFRARIREAETMIHGSQPLFVFDNHDNPRLDRFCTLEAGAPAGADCAAIGKMLSTILLTTRAAALLYYGDEIGMTTTPPARKEDVKDPVGITGWPKDKGRDGERTPMQWSPTEKAGFTTGIPWLPIPPDHVTINVQSEQASPDSVLSYYAKLISLRSSNPALHSGELVMLNPGDTDVLSYLRKYGKTSVIVANNFTNQPKTIAINLNTQGIAGSNARTLAASFPHAPAGVSLSSIVLPPYGAFVGEVK